MSREEERQYRKTRLQRELQDILDAAHEYAQEELEEDDGLEIEAVQAITKAAYQMAYTKKYYDASKDELIYFPSVKRLVLRNEIQERAEKYYYEDEFPLEYSKALKTVVRQLILDQGGKEEDNENEDYMEKLAQDVEV